MNITVFGIGYVGLVQAAVLADAGHRLCCADIDEEKVARLKEGVISIHEPGLKELVRDGLNSGRLHFTTDMDAAVNRSEMLFIAVGTPPEEDGSADTRHVLAVADTIGRRMQNNKIVIIKSTVPVGTADRVAGRIAAVLAGRDVSFAAHVVSNPEFLKEGAAVADCQRPDRIVIGTDSAYAEKRMRELYAPYNRNHEKIMVMDVRSAELTKYAANCMLAAKISFMNEMANIAEKVGADVESVRRGIGADPRIGYQFIYPGCGYGGSCFPKDVRALVRTSTDVGYTPELLSAVDNINRRQKQRLFELLCHHFGGDLHGKTIAVWGLSFKPNTDDMRDAPSRDLLEALWSAGAIVNAYDPEAGPECLRVYGERDDLKLAASRDEALQGADALAICTEWNEFRAPDFDLIAECLSARVVVDGRNLYSPAMLAERGIAYYGIGRGLAVRTGKIS